MPVRGHKKSDKHVCGQLCEPAATDEERHNSCFSMIFAEPFSSQTGTSLLEFRPSVVCLYFGLHQKTSQENEVNA